MKQEVFKQEVFQKLWNLIKPIKVGMLVIENEKNLHAMPMHLVQNEFEGNLYFFTHSQSDKVFEIKKDSRVCVSFSSTELQTYVSVSGEATICKDKALIDRFWNMFVSAWFPEGKESAVSLIKIDVMSAEYWDTKSFKIVQLFNYAQALIQKEKPEMGEHEKVEL